MGRTIFAASFEVLQPASSNVSASALWWRFQHALRSRRLSRYLRLLCGNVLNGLVTIKSAAATEFFVMRHRRKYDEMLMYKGFKKEG